jgi:mycofactocin precursor
MENEDSVEIADHEPIDDPLEEELLIEEISIDGMCGVY